LVFFFIPVCTQVCQSLRPPLARGTPQENSALWLGLPALEKANRSTMAKGQRWRRIFGTASGGKAYPSGFKHCSPNTPSLPRELRETKENKSTPLCPRGKRCVQCGEDRMDSHNWVEHAG